LGKIAGVLRLQRPFKMCKRGPDACLPKMARNRVAFTFGRHVLPRCIFAGQKYLEHICEEHFVKLQIDEAPHQAQQTTISTAMSSKDALHVHHLHFALNCKKQLDQT
jgi:hypothetical protein